MIALDTNILVRVVVKDDDDQVTLARRLIRRCKTTKELCLITIAVLCELQWVLQRTYKASRQDLAAAVEMLLDDDVFVVEETELVRQALDRYRNGRADFSDYLLGARGQSLGAVATFTFDKKLGREDGFTLLEEEAFQEG